MPKLKCQCGNCRICKHRKTVADLRAAKKRQEELRAREYQYLRYFERRGAEFQ